MGSPVFDGSALDGEVCVAEGADAFCGATGTIGSTFEQT